MLPAALSMWSKPVGLFLAWVVGEVVDQQPLGHFMVLGRRAKPHTSKLGIQLPVQLQKANFYTDIWLN